MGIVHVGAPAAGMNAATRAAARLALDRGHTVMGYACVCRAPRGTAWLVRL